MNENQPRFVKLTGYDTKHHKKVGDVILDTSTPFQISEIYCSSATNFRYTAIYTSTVTLKVTQKASEIFDLIHS